MSVGSLHRPPLQAASKARHDAKLERMAASRSERELQLSASVERFAEKRERALQDKSDFLHAHNERSTDLQLLRISQDFDRGTRVVALEPPISHGWAAARPHLNSHWSTIGRIHDDPPARVDAKPIVNFRRMYPEQAQASGGASKPPTVLWGGSHDMIENKGDNAKARV